VAWAGHRPHNSAAIARDVTKEDAVDHLLDTWYGQWEVDNPRQELLDEISNSEDFGEDIDELKGFSVACVNDPEFMASMLGMSNHLDKRPSQLSGGLLKRYGFMVKALNRTNII
jgi:hypothetical protein